MGVWIETRALPQAFTQMSVTPCVGVWIETSPSAGRRLELNVTPCVGVWIETLFSVWFGSCFTSHPAWVCGLKRVMREQNAFNAESHPAWVCGLKHIILEAGLV